MVNEFIQFCKRVLDKLNYLKEQQILKQRRQRFYARFIKPGDLCFDVGANMGNRVAPLLKIGARVIAVEPQPECCRVLKKKFGNKIKLIEKGLGAEEGVLNFYVSSSHTLSSFSREWIDKAGEARFVSETWSQKIQIEVTTLDELINNFGVPHFVKIDVEGFELKVLRGLSHAINYVSFEYTVPELTQQVVDCVSLIQGHQKANRIECNYSIGESMEWALQKWISPSQMISHIKAKDFIDTGFGDMYVRKILL